MKEAAKTVAGTMVQEELKHEELKADVNKAGVGTSGTKGNVLSALAEEAKLNAKY